MDKSLAKIYYNIKHPASFGGARNLISAAKHQNIHINDVNDWLASQDSYTRHKNIVRKFNRQKVLVAGIDSQWQIDLSVLISLAEFNDGYNYLFCCIDVFSKFGWIEPLYTKEGVEIVRVMKKIFSETKRRPEKICSDQGTEFLNSSFQQLLIEENIGFFVTVSEKKACIVERWQRTIKERMFRYFRFKNTFRYIDVIQDIVKNYNNTIHSTTGIQPSNVNTSNELKIWKKMRSNIKKPSKKNSPKFFENQTVRLNTLKSVFEKGYTGRWTEEIFFIDKIYRQFLPYMYRLRDSNNEKIKGRFYEKELVRVIIPENKEYIVDKILNYKTVNKQRYALIHWRGYPDSANSWEPVEAIKQL